MSKESEQLAKKIKIHSVKMAHYAEESHVACALSIADIVAVLYSSILNVYPQNFKEDSRDRFILSKGHACSAVYATLAEKGFFPMEELYLQGRNGSRLSGHMNSYNVPGVEFSTGSLGHGCCVACGMALAGKLTNKYYHVFSLIGDGECNEGSVWEMAQFAYHKKLNNLTIIIDYNKMQAMGNSKEVLDPINLFSKWRAFGWNVLEVDGHNHEELEAAFSLEQVEEPVCIIAHTIKGKGVSFMENNLLWHYRDPQGEKYELALRELEV